MTEDTDWKETCVNTTNDKRYKEAKKMGIRLKKLIQILMYLNITNVQIKQSPLKF